MSKYDGNYFGKDTESSFNIPYGLVMIFASLGILLLMIFGVNSCTHDEWNDGFCPDCEVRYEMGGVYNGLKYYYCPGCGDEVQRY